MAQNPHFDRETITEDIGFRGPHVDFNIDERIIDTRTPTQAWTPEGEYGQHGEHSGWRLQEDPPSYKSDWQDYPADEFIGIQSNVPSDGGFLKEIFEGLYGVGFDTPYAWRQDEDLLAKRKYNQYLEFQNQNRDRFNPEPGPWNEFNPRSRYGNVIEQDWGEDLLANLDNWELFHLMGNGYTLEEAQEILERQLG